MAVGLVENVAQTAMPTLHNAGQCNMRPNALAHPAGNSSRCMLTSCGEPKPWRLTVPAPATACQGSTHKYGANNPDCRSPDARALFCVAPQQQSTRGCPRPVAPTILRDSWRCPSTDSQRSLPSKAEPPCPCSQCYPSLEEQHPSALSRSYTSAPQTRATPSKQRPSRLTSAARMQWTAPPSLGPPLAPQNSKQPALRNRLPRCGRQLTS